MAVTGDHGWQIRAPRGALRRLCRCSSNLPPGESISALRRGPASDFGPAHQGRMRDEVTARAAHERRRTSISKRQVMRTIHLESDGAHDLGVRPSSNLHRFPQRPSKSWPTQTPRPFSPRSGEVLPKSSSPRAAHVTTKHPATMRGRAGRALYRGPRLAFILRPTLQKTISAPSVPTWCAL